MLLKTPQVVLDCMAPLEGAGVIDFPEEAMPMDEAFYALVDAGDQAIAQQEGSFNDLVGKHDAGIG